MSDFQTTPCPEPYSAYSMNVMGQMFNSKGVLLGGHMNKAGYITHSLTDITGERHMLQAHRLVYWTFHPDFDQTHEVDHIDACPAHNWLSNLQALSKHDHQAKTRSDNPGMYSVKGLGTRRANRCRKIVYIHPITDIETPYETIALAMAATGLSEGTIRSHLATNSRGWYWDREALSGETWYNVVAQGCGGRDYSRFEVSNLGRIRTASANETFGSVNCHGRLMFKGVQVHHVICTAFHGPPCEEGLCVVHVNKNVQDNRPENLAWSSCVAHYVPPTAWAKPLTKGGDIVKTGLTLLQSITGGVEKAAFVDSLPFFMPLKDMEAALRELVDQFDKAKIQTFQDLFRLKPDATPLKTVHRVMKYAFGVSVTRKYRQPEKSGFHIAKFYIETP
jgi:hypothetical protein